MTNREPDALVIGAGVIGLSTAVCLAESGMRVRIRTASLPKATASAAAAAICGPVFAPPEDRAGTWERATVEEFTKLAAVPGTGVRIARGRLAAREKPSEPLPLRGTPLQLCDPDRLPDGFVFGFWLRVPLIDMARYIDYLSDRFREAGGRIELGALTSLAEAASTAPLVANCTGVGARDLVPDPSVRPVRGQHVVVENPGLDSFFVEDARTASWAGYFPHGDHVVLGGTAAADDWRLDPDPDEADQILRRCVEVEPRLRGARVLDHRVGLRPGRPSVRLEAEEVDGARCVHNYGHGSSGVGLSWGCAREATKLLTS